MANRRRPATQITPVYEDSGLFKREVRDVEVELMPAFSRNGRGDLVVKGIVKPEAEVEVVFAGRRTREAAALVERMKQLHAQGVRTAAGRDTMAQIRRLRLPVKVRGTWRLRFVADESGWDLKTYQLLAAQWAFTDLDGMTVLSGRPPERQENRVQDRAREARARNAAVRAMQAARTR